MDILSPVLSFLFRLSILQQTYIVMCTHKPFTAVLSTKTNTGFPRGCRLSAREYFLSVVSDLYCVLVLSS